MKAIDPQIEALFQAGVHLGHKKNRIHPKAKKYIYIMQNGISVIDLTQTQTLLKKAQEFVSKLKKENKVMIVIMTKKVVAGFVAEMCKKNSIPFITMKWPAGLLTNFEMIMKNVKKMNEMRKQQLEGAWNTFIKHEQIALKKELRKLERFYGGLSDLTKKPDALFIVDIKKEKNAVKEARELKIPVVAVTDTNVNPDFIDYPIPGNDDSQSSIEYLVKEIVEAYTKTI